ncbi:MAG: ABC transporter ATP-binding protein [Bacteroidota bacterium]
METIIKVEQISKSYVLRHEKQARYIALRDVITNKTKQLFQKEKNIPSKEIFWALNNVSFEIKERERLGIIGRNGAGKSTLLKILSRIVEPTKGRITINGRIASLLEVGTGFHPELTGRENIFLNGAILGMSKSEILRKFDEIVAFAEIEKFLDTPVKRYSSGMYVRLAFAVAAHLEPEILIVDEVLAVGDAEFQKKCLGKMKDASRNEGRTVIFVSHNMSAIRSICTRAILLEDGKINCIGDVNEVLPFYLGLSNTKSIKGFKIAAIPLSSTGEWEIGTDIEISVSWEKYKYAPGWHCDIACYTLDGSKIFALESHKFKDFFSNDKEYNGIKFIVRNIGFNSDDLRIDVGVKRAAAESYFVVLENCIILTPSNKNIPDYKREDVIIVPPSQCQAIKN